VDNIYNEINVREVNVPDIKFRKLKFQTERGWCERRFSNHRQLQKYLLRNQPVNCYQSVSLYTFRDKRFKSEMFVDLDSKNIPNLELCLKLIKDKGYSVNRIINSGGGFHVFFDSVRYRKPFLKYLKDNGVDVDDKVHDRTRVSRICGSWNQNKQSFSSFISSDGMERLEADDSEIRPVNYNKSVPENHATQASFFRFIPSKCKKEYVYFKLFNSLDYAERMIKRLQKKHNIGTTAIIKYDTPKGFRFGTLSIKTFPPAKLKKMERRWKKRVIMVSGYSNGKNFTTEHPKLLKILEQDVRGNYSEYHRWWINFIGGELRGIMKKPNFFVMRV